MTKVTLRAQGVFVLFHYDVDSSRYLSLPLSWVIKLIMVVVTVIAKQCFIQEDCIQYVNLFSGTLDVEAFTLTGCVIWYYNSPVGWFHPFWLKGFNSSMFNISLLDQFQHSLLFFSHSHLECCSCRENRINPYFLNIYIELNRAGKLANTPVVSSMRWHTIKLVSFLETF